MRKTTINFEDLQIPQAKDAERVLIGGMLADVRIIGDSITQLKESDFYLKSHRLIFSAIETLFIESKAVDCITVGALLEERGELETIGGLADLADMLDPLYIPTSVKEYIRLIKDASAKRKLLAASRQSIAAITDGEELSAVLSNLQTDLDSSHIKEQPAEVGFMELVRGEVDRFESIGERGAAVNGIPSGFDKLDELTTGFQQGEVTLIAARTSAGKSAMALNILEHAAFAGYSVGFISAEMTKESLVRRLICAAARVDSQRARSGYLGREEWARIAIAQQKLAEIIKPPLVVDSVYTPLGIRASCRKWKARQGLDLLIVDYLQKLTADGRYENRQQEIASISHKIGETAKEFRIPVIALCQLNRKAEEREDQEPRLSDLRESGSQEQDADNVIFIVRKPQYDEQNPSLNRVANIYIGKQRNGPTGSFRLTYIPEFTRFENYAEVR